MSTSLKSTNLNLGGNSLQKIYKNNDYTSKHLSNQFMNSKYTKSFIMNSLPLNKPLNSSFSQINKKRNMYLNN